MTVEIHLTAVSKILNLQNNNKQTMGENSIIQPLLTDFYQLTMAYAYWKAGKTENHAIFDLFFRKNPFHGEYTVFAGLQDCLRFLENFKYSASDIAYIRQILPVAEEEFYAYLTGIGTSKIQVYACAEGTVVFPRVTLMRVEGPLVVAQLIETTLLNLVNYASLMATNAARYKMAAGRHIGLYEFGLRRAQGPDGGLSASKYSYIGGFDGTSNVLAGKLFGIPVRGTHAHSYVTSFNGLEHTNELLQISLDFRENLATLFKVMLSEVNDGELAAFVSFARALPDSFMALVDTYDVKKSGLVNFCAVALALDSQGHRAVGVRLDSGDLAYLSCVARQYFRQVAVTYQLSYFEHLTVMASNDINEETIVSLTEQQHCINAFGIGTHLVTCQKQPALGCVYKMVELNNEPRIKLSQDVAKVTVPGRKDIYRLYGENGCALIDLLQRAGEPEPEVGERVLCRHPFEESKRAYVIPSKVERLLQLRFDRGRQCRPAETLQTVRDTVKASMDILRPDIKRNLNPTPYKVAVSDELYQFLHNLWLANAPIGELM